MFTNKGAKDGKKRNFEKEKEKKKKKMKNLLQKT